MRVLFIGGTGLISSACSDLAVQRGMELSILTRGKSENFDIPAAAHILQADIHGEPQKLVDVLNNSFFDVVVDWIAYTLEDIERDISRFNGKTRQLFLSAQPVRIKNHPHIT